MRVEADHLQKENNSRIESQNQILALNKQMIAGQLYLNVFTGIIGLLLGILSFVLVRNIRQKQRINVMLDSKVKERTGDLEMNREVLHRSCIERDVLIDKAVSEIGGSVATIRGLCLTGLADKQDVAQYLEKVNATSDTLIDVLAMLRNRQMLFQQLESRSPLR